MCIRDRFIDFLPELPQDDGTSKVSFYIDAENDYEEILEQVKAGIEEWRQFVDIGEGSIVQSETCLLYTSRCV